MKRAAAYGIVGIAVADLRSHARHDSELRSQLLLGEMVEFRGAGPGAPWVKVTGLEDGYSGWMRSWALIPAGAEGVRRWRSRSGATIRALMEPVFSADSDRSMLMPLFFGARLEVVRTRGARVEIRLPDGRTGIVTRGAIRLAGERPASLGERLSAMMGIPYLWGGRTPAGLDCSGFTQLVLAEQGISLPRDARDQFRSSRPLEPGEVPRPGDLLFFGRPNKMGSHVAIIRERGTYVHCRGSVMEGSMNPDSALCDKDLLAQVRGIRRPSRPPARGTIRASRGSKSP